MSLVYLFMGLQILVVLGVGVFLIKKIYAVFRKRKKNKRI